MKKNDTAWLYPYNLALSIANGSMITSESIGDNWEKVKEEAMSMYLPSLLESLSELSDREQDIIRMRYEVGFTLEQVGRSFGVTRERVRQIEMRALRKLKVNRIRNEYQTVPMNEFLKAKEKIAKLEKENSDIRERIAAITSEEPVPVETEKTVIYIDDLELSIRSHNCLARAGITTLDELSKYTVDDLKKVRNLGMRSLQEIISECRKYGVELSYGDK